jgi:ABC-type glutathione transport system ATPase component
MVPAVDVSGLCVRTRSRVLVDSVEFSIAPGERVGLIGESGSGKSLTSLAIMGLLPDNLTASGSVSIAGSPNVVGLTDKEMAPYRGRVASMVFQEPMTALDPLMRVGDQLAEVLRHGGNSEVSSSGTRSRSDLHQAVVPGLTEVGLPDPASAARAYPHQLSGGQRQRVMIAMALANEPALLVADEPTTALDVTVQAQVLDLMVRLVEERGAGLLFITHDLAVVSRVCERVLVMLGGNVVESGSITDVFGSPQHEYTRRLLAASDLETLDLGLPSTSAMPSVSVMPQEGEAPPIIRFTNVSKVYSRGRTQPPVQAMNAVSLDIYPGERFGIVGESGSGKTTALRMLTALDTPTSGTVEVKGLRLDLATKSQMAALRRNQQMVFQDPLGSLDPRMTIGRIVAEPLLALRIPKAERVQTVEEMLLAVGLPADTTARYPHQFSGGQRQRIAIARALVTQPSIVVADEPVSALDVSVRAQVLELLARLTTQRNLTLVMVSHDLAVVRHLCHRVAVMQNGTVVEVGTTQQVWDDPQHSYTKRLQASTPVMEIATQT